MGRFSIDQFITRGCLTNSQMHELACVLAERIAHICGDPPWAMALIAAKRAWLRGEITEQELESARAAAKDDAQKVGVAEASDMGWNSLGDPVFASAWGASQLDPRTALRVAAKEAAWGIAFDLAYAAAFDATKASARDIELARARNEQVEYCLALLDAPTVKRCLALLEDTHIAIDHKSIEGEP